MLSCVPLLVSLMVAVATEMYVERESAEGRVRGQIVQVLGRGVEQYRGIPFAEPPLGELRFRPPLPKEPWTGTLDATCSATACPQVVMPEAGMNGLNYTEDCLYLNVWAPEYATPPASKRPVLVWIYGGGFNSGSSNEASYSGATIVAMTGLLMVSMNYRINVLGFLNAQSSEAPGNMGLLDQVMALQWVQRNIRSFGGDPDRVTLFGQSAGAASTHAHILSPMSKGLFKRALIMSGSMSSIDEFDMLSESIAKSNKVADIVGCSQGESTSLSSNAKAVINCLRKKSVDQLINASSEATAPKMCAFFPTYNDSFMPLMPLVSVSRGFFEPVDIIAGVTSDEAAASFLSTAPPELLAEPLEYSEGLADALHAVVSMWLTIPTPDIELQYAADAPKDDGSALRRQYINYESDRMLNCPLRSLAEKHSARGIKVFAYIFSYKSPTAPYPSWVGAPHLSDVPYAFGHVYAQQPNSTDGRISEAFVRMIATFAESGVPKMPSGEDWPQYTSSSPVMVVMKDGPFNKTRSFREAFCGRFEPLFGQFE